MVIWIGFNLFVLFILALDLGLFHKQHKEIPLKEALLWSIAWTLLAMLVNVWVYFALGSHPALQFFTGYWIERALSIDNLFVFALIFAYFKVPKQYIYRVLYWGIFGALVMRAIFIFAGVALIQLFHPIIYIFGALLIYSGIKMALQKETQESFEETWLVAAVRRWIPISDSYDKHYFFIKQGSRLIATPLFLVLIAIETTDLIFAIDSIPAVLAITTDPFIVYSSNVMAIIGLRALYFALAHAIKAFRYLHYGLALILCFVGTKMLLSEFYEISVHTTLGIVAATLAVSILASLWKNEQA